ncbi:MAG: hypothetical protein ACREE7_07305, partial [Dongiaceae bacterium]
LDERDLELAIHADARKLAEQDGVPARDHALYDGEDYELIVVLPADRPPADCERLNLLPIGRTVAQPGLFLRQTDGRAIPLEIRGWEHFLNRKFQTSSTKSETNDK